MQLVHTCHARTARPGWIKSPNPSRRCLPYQPTDGRKVSPPTCCTQYAHAASPHTDFPTGGRPQGMRSGSATTGRRCARCRWWPSRGLGAAGARASTCAACGWCRRAWAVRTRRPSFQVTTSAIRLLGAECSCSRLNLLQEVLRRGFWNEFRL